MPSAAARRCHLRQLAVRVKTGMLPSFCHSFCAVFDLLSRAALV